MIFKNREEYLSLRNEMMGEAQNLLNEGKVDESSSKMEEIEELDAAFEKFAKAQANLNAMNSSPSSALLNNTMGARTPETMGAGQGDEDLYDSMEYRKAFMNNVLKGTQIPEKFTNADANTKTTDVASVIPTTVLNRIIEKMEMTERLQ